MPTVWETDAAGLGCGIESGGHCAPAVAAKDARRTAANPARIAERETEASKRMNPPWDLKVSRVSDTGTCGVAQSSTAMRVIFLDSPGRAHKRLITLRQ
jgi:hypothetical protein